MTVKTYTAAEIKKAVQGSFPFLPRTRLTGAEFKKACSLAKAKLGAGEKDEVDGLASAVRAEEQAALSAIASAMAKNTTIRSVGKERLVIKGGKVSVAHSVLRDRDASKQESEIALREFLKKEEPQDASEITLANFQAKRRAACLALRQICPAYDLEQSKIEAKRAAEYVAALIKSGIGE